MWLGCSPLPWATLMSCYHRLALFWFTYLFVTIQRFGLATDLAFHSTNKTFFHLGNRCIC
jgi:hypothetical protein